MSQPRQHLLAVGFALAAAGLAFGSKLVMVHAYGSDVPYMDEWDALGRVLFIPRSLGELHAADFLEAQNEHRIILSRLLGYSLTVANRQWDPLLEMTVNAAIHAGFCAALLLFARRLVKGVRFAAVALATTSLFVLPFDWENTLEGIQSQFYLLEWGALCVFVLCAPSRALSRRWWMGLLAGVLGLGTMSTGFFAPAAVLLLMAVRAGFERRFTGRDAAGATLLGALCAVGLMAVAHVPGHDILKARSPAEWLAAAAAALSWPELGWPVAFIVLQLPMAILVARCVRARSVGRDESVLVCLALWTWMQTAAIAYGRANFGMVGSPRYMDLYAVGSFANVLALAIQPRPGPRALAWGAMAAAWTVLFSCGLWARDSEAHTLFLDDYPRLKELQGRQVRSFLATGDLARLSSAAPEELPYPRPNVLGALLNAPGIRSLLPAGVRPAIPLLPGAESGGFDVTTSPGLHAALAGRTWVARRGPAHFVSQPLPGDCLPFLHIAMSGSPGLDSSALHIETADGGEPIRRFSLDGNPWHAADIAVPAVPDVRLVVDVPPGDHWLAFTEPVELGRGSWMNHWLLRRSGLVETVAAVLFLTSWLTLLCLDLLRQPAKASQLDSSPPDYP